MFFISVSFRLLATAVSLKVSPPGPVWKEWVKSPRISPSSCRQRHPQNSRCFRAPQDRCTANIKNQPALPLAQCCSLHEKIVQQQFRSQLLLDLMTIRITQLKPAFFFRASGVQTKKNASFPKKTSPKQENLELHQFHPSVTLNLNFQKINQILKESARCAYRPRALLRLGRGLTSHLQR